MPFTCSLAPERVAVEPGGDSQITLQLQNRGAVVDELTIEVLGDAASWITLSRSRVAIFPGQSDTVAVELKPPRASHLHAGIVPVGFRVTSTIDPRDTAVEECRVEVKPFANIAARVIPRTARGRFGSEQRLLVSNLGNAPASVSVHSEVTQGDCRVLVPLEPINVLPGEQQTAKIKVRPTSTFLRGPQEFHQYRLTVESPGAAPATLDATMRQLPVLQIPVAFLVAAALVLGGGYVLYGHSPSSLRGALTGLWHGTVDVGSNSTSANSNGSPGTTGSQPPTSPVVATPPPCVPGRPTNVVATASSTTAKVTWSAPSASCGLPVTAYTVYASTGGLSQRLTNPGSDLSVTFSNLTNGTSYSFTVTASNGNGTGPASAASAAVTPATVPGFIVSAAASPGDTTVLVTWAPPASDGGSPITGYLVLLIPSGGHAIEQQLPGTARSATFSGLANGALYNVQIAAVNAVGQGPLGPGVLFAKPVCAAVHIVTFTASFTSVSWHATGDCAPFAGTIKCNISTVNSSGQHGGGTSTTQLTTLDGSASDTVTGFTNTYVSCQMNITDHSGNSDSASDYVPKP